jgi:hypothetical protein
MAHTTVRITRSTHELLREIAGREKVSMQAVLERALEAYRRQRFLEEVNEGYARMQADPVARDAFDTELAGWDHAIADGLGGKSVVRLRAKRARPTRRGKGA